MAAFNGEKYLAEQLNSILSQTLKPDEIIVCDDCSTDGTAGILERYAHNDQVKFFVNDNRLGLINNFKNAVSKARAGNYIALSDQDDVWLPEKLQKCADALVKIEQKDQPCMVHSDLWYVDAVGETISTSFRAVLGQHKYEQNLQTLLYGNFVNGCTTLFNPFSRKGFLAMPDKINLNHDGWMALWVFTFGQAAYIDEPLVRYRKHGGNASIANEKPVHNRFISTLNQAFNAFKNSDEFLNAQLNTVHQFYRCYQSEMDDEKRRIFEKFLKLKNASFFVKKLAFARIVRKYARKKLKS